MYDKNYIPSRTSPKGDRRGCLCWETSTYSIKCCDGSVRAQGVGSVYFTDDDSNLPINVTPPVISGTAERGETLSSTTGTWTGTGTITFAYQWRRDNVDISGATSSTYVLVEADDNTSITCVVTATDDVGSTSISSNAISPILGSPYNLVAPVASGTGQVGQTLSTTNGSWQGVATITFTYQWRRDASDISGATSSTYTLVADDYSTDIDCVVTATNSLGSANQDSNDIANIAGSVPVISGVPTISGTPKVGETLTATAASVTGTPTPTDTFQWQRSDDGSTGWANVSGATNTTYTAVSADEGKYLRVVQTSTNEVGSDTANSASTTQVAAAFTGLLDTYSGASVAVSLRLLRTDYEGNCIRVRRSSDNAEQNIGFRNNVLDTSALTTFCGESDGFVTTWYDQSENANDMSESTSQGQPKIVSNGSYLGYLDFDGLSRTLNSPFEMVYQNQFSSFMVAQSPESQQAVMMGVKEFGNAYWNVAQNGSSSDNFAGLQNVTSFVNGSSIDTTRDALNDNITSFALISTLARYNINAEPQYKLRFGYTSASWHNFKCKEMVHYDNQSVSRTGVEDNITTYYGF